MVGGHNLEVNVLVNKAIRRYIEWGRYVDSFKLVTSDPRLMKTLWSHVTVGEAREMDTKNGKDTGGEYILYHFRNFPIDSVLNTLDEMGAECKNPYVYRERGDK